MARTVDDAHRRLMAAQANYAYRLVFDGAMRTEHADVPLVGSKTAFGVRMRYWYEFTIGSNGPLPRMLADRRDLREQAGPIRIGQCHRSHGYGDLPEWEMEVFAVTEEGARAFVERVAVTLERDGSLRDLRLPQPRDMELLLVEVGSRKWWRGYDLRAA